MGGVQARSHRAAPPAEPAEALAAQGTARKPGRLEAGPPFCWPPAPRGRPGCELWAPRLRLMAGTSGKGGLGGEAGRVDCGQRSVGDPGRGGAGGPGLPVGALGCGRQGPSWRWPLTTEALWGGSGGGPAPTVAASRSPLSPAWPRGPVRAGGVSPGGAGWAPGQRLPTTRLPAHLCSSLSPWGG